MVTVLLLPPGGESLNSFVFYSLVSSLFQGMTSDIFLIPIMKWQKLPTITHADDIFLLIPGHDIISTRHLLCLNLGFLGERRWVKEKVCLFVHFFMALPACLLVFSTVLN